jgi:hypothetical protein
MYVGSGAAAVVVATVGLVPLVGQGSEHGSRPVAPPPPPAVLIASSSQGARYSVVSSAVHTQLVPTLPGWGSDPQSQTRRADRLPGRLRARWTHTAATSSLCGSSPSTPAAEVLRSDLRCIEGEGWSK